ncbi:MAG: D-2-hydroxyacid dehydrogenase [Acidimicrobiales bacterium]|nr:MAG: D-2-hydroxyacid dehydrogenase [Acidimicrobiales bacterium]
MDALDRLEREGRLPSVMRPVLVDDGGVEPSAARGVEILWRTGLASSSSDWLIHALGQLPDLAWVHSDFVGVDNLPLAELVRRAITVTNGAGNYSRPMAEWVLLAMLSAAKDLPAFVRRSDAAVWDPGRELAELDGAHMLLLGLGSVGQLVASMAAPFGLRVTAAVRSSRDTLPTGVDRLVVGEAWRAELASADFVVCALPLTPATEGMIDEAALDAMKSTAWLVNVARGGLIKKDALVDALDKASIAGAFLDAFVEEPLPPGHPLWGRDNVIIIPHHTWSSARTWERIDHLFAEQLSRWVAGVPLANVIDPAEGY